MSYLRLGVLRAYSETLIGEGNLTPLVGNTFHLRIWQAKVGAVNRPLLSLAKS